MNWSGLFQDPIAASIWAVFAGVVGFVAKPIVDMLLVKKKGDVELKKAVIEKEPDLIKVLSDGMINLVKEQASFREKIDAQSEKIDAQSEKIDQQAQKIDAQANEIISLHEKIAEMGDHIDSLTDALKANNIAPPARRKRPITEKAD